MKKFLFLALVIGGLAACETPQPATGTTDDTNTQSNQSGTTGSGTTGTGTGTTTDTTTNKRDSLPQ